MLIVFLMDQDRNCSSSVTNHGNFMINNTLATFRLQLSCLFLGVEFVQLSGLLVVQSCRHGIILVTLS
jgi:hypothetical protein